jgi:fibronectin-binding autotransporter adhesin
MLSRRLSTTLAFGCFLAWAVPSSRAQVWIGPGGTGGSGNWGDSTNWDTGIVPNAVGASAAFNDPPAARTITMNVSSTVGTLTTTIGSANNNTFSGTSSLTFDNGGAGATLTVNGTGTGNNSVQWPTVLNDTLTIAVNDTSATSAAGAITFAASSTITGGGGLTKTGPGLLTLANVTKQYTGPTQFLDGRVRISSAGRPVSTSSLTVNGGQIDLISASTYTFGASSSVPLNLNGAGPTSGPFAAFPGAIRPDTNLAIGITNVIVLQSDSLIHIQGSSGGVMTLSGNISGPGRLSQTPAGGPFDANLGRIIVTGTNNTYAGGTTVNGGTFEVAAGSSLGTGNVTINSANAVFAGAQAHLQLDGTSGSTINAISDSAVLSLSGGNVGGTADDGYIDLTSGVNEVVSGLILGGVAQPPGVYSAATSPEYILGTGTITVVPVPEPGTLALAGLAAAGLVARGRLRRKPAVA